MTAMMGLRQRIRVNNPSAIMAGLGRRPRDLSQVDSQDLVTEGMDVRDEEDHSSQ